MTNSLHFTDEEIDEFVARKGSDWEEAFAHKLLNEFRRRTGKTTIDLEDRELAVDITQELIHEALAQETLDSLVMNGLATASVMPDGRLGYTAVEEIESGEINPRDFG